MEHDDLDLRTVVADLRELHLHPAQVSNTLEFIWPEPLQGIKRADGGHVRTSGLDAAILVIRHLNSFLPPRLRARDDSAETSNHLLAYAWLHIPHITPRSDAHVLRSISSAQSTLANFVRSQPEMMADLSFASIMECMLMRTTFWARESCILFHSRGHVKPPGTDEWSEQTVDAQDRAKISLVRWDGSEPLGGFISDQFEVYEGDEPGEEHWLQSNSSRFIRVLYTPSEGDGPGFDSVKVIEVGSLVLGEATDDSRVRQLAYLDPTPYNLVAAVRLRQHPDEDDAVRLYTLFGQHIRPPFPTTACTYSQDQWRLGEQGHSYMLYFVKVSDQDFAPDPDSFEVHAMSDEWIQDTRSLVDMRNSDLSAVPPLPAMPDDRLAVPAGSSTGQKHPAPHSGVEGQAKRPRMDKGRVLERPGGSSGLGPHGPRWGGPPRGGGPSQSAGHLPGDRGPGAGHGPGGGRGGRGGSGQHR